MMDGSASPFIPIAHTQSVGLLGGPRLKLLEIVFNYFLPWLAGLIADHGGIGFGRGEDEIVIGNGGIKDKPTYNVEEVTLQLTLGVYIQEDFNVKEAAMNGCARYAMYALMDNITPVSVEFISVIKCLEGHIET